MSGMRNMAEVQAGLDRTKRPCRHCGRIMRSPNLVTHEPGCAPEAREERRIRHMLRAREVRSRPGWVRPPEKRDECPSCGGFKVASAARCKDCDKGGPRPRPVAERFWEKVGLGDLDECWLWTGAVNEFGYGAFHVGDNRAKGAHRIAYELTYGPLPKGQGALHRCDNPPCCNPFHLFAGTQGDNMRDAASKGRCRTQRRVA